MNLKRELRIKVAELCGYVKYRDYGDGHWKSIDGNDFLFSELPDYPNDLNAIVEVVRQQRYKNQFFFHAFQFKLLEIVHDAKIDDYSFGSLAAFELLTADATDWCLAFVAVMEGE